MSVVSNSSPLIALARIQRLDLIPTILQSALIPPAVAREIAPSIPVLPHWLEVRAPPFISEALYRELFDNLLMAAQAEETSVRVHRPDEANWYETGEKNLGKLMESAERASQLIRERMGSLSVLPEVIR